MGLLGFCVYFLVEAGKAIQTTLQIRQVRRAIAAETAEGTLATSDPFGRGSGVVTGWEGPVNELQNMSAPGGHLEKRGMSSVGVKFGGSQYGGILPYGTNTTEAGCEPGNADACDEDDPPNGKVMLAFGLIGVGVDVITIGYYVFMAKCSKQAKSMEVTMNMTSAALHVIADLVRCAATIVAAIYIILNPGWASAGADDLGGMIVTILIAIGTLIGIYECLKDKFCIKGAQIQPTESMAMDVESSQRSNVQGDATKP